MALGLAHAVPSTTTPVWETLPPLFLGRRISGSCSRAGTQPCLSACLPQWFLNYQKTFKCPEGVMGNQQDSPEPCFTLARFQHQTSPAAGVGRAGAWAPTPIPPTLPPCPSPAPVTRCTFRSPRRGDWVQMCAMVSAAFHSAISTAHLQLPGSPGVCSAPQSS